MTIKLPPLPRSAKLRRESQRDGSVHLVPAHAILVLDLVLFFIYLVVTSVELIKGMKS